LHLPERKVIIEVDINDNRVNSIDDTKSKRRSDDLSSIKGTLGLNLEYGEEYLLYLGAVKRWSEALSHIGDNYSISEEVCAVSDRDDYL